MDDFASVPTTVQARRSRPQKLTIDIPGGIRMPVAPPSPFFDGMNEDINTEPFPDFIDPCLTVMAEPLHCILHCKDSVCKHMVKKDITMLPCRCGDEVDQKSTLVISPPLNGPAISLDGAIFATIKDVELDIDTDQTIEIQQHDARNLLEQFKILVTRRAFANEEFMSTVRGEAPCGPEDAARDLIISPLFKLLQMYLERTTRGTNSRTITPQDLGAELKVYLYTGLAEWINEHSNYWERQEILENCPGKRLVLEAANFGMPGAVSKLWVECLDNVVRLFVWRHVQVQKAKANQKVRLLGLSV
jgi:hypothetical protein